MARLSRKERFAGLREQMATNKEESLATNDLDKFAERLKQLNEVFGDDVQKLLKREERPEEQFKDFKIPSFEEAKDNLNKGGEQVHDFLKELDISKLNKNIDELINHKEEKPIEVIEEPVAPKPEPIVETQNEEVVDEISKIIEEEPVKEEAELVDVQPALSDEDFKDVTKIIDVDELNKKFNKSNETYEDDINHLIDELLQDKKEEKVEEPTKEDENPNQEVEVIEDNTPIVVLPVKEVEKPVVEIKKTIINPINEDEVVASLVKIIGPVTLYVKKEKPVYVPKAEPVIEEPIKKEVHDSQNELDISKLNKNIDELINHKEEKPIEEIPVDTEDEVDGTTTIVNGNYLDEALKEANDYNHQEGNKTLDELKDHFYKKEEPKEKIDEEFSNTVNLEIDKVLSEVQKDVEEAKETKQEEKVEDLNKTAVFEHPVLAKEASDGVEILPMEETLKLDVIDDTIPFTALENEEDDDDDEDNGFGKVINIILIILIVVLVVIIGIIGYFLLAANGVI